MSYFIAVIGLLLIGTYPLATLVLVSLAAWMHQAGFVTPIGELAEIVLFYGAIAGILTVIFI